MKKAILYLLFSLAVARLHAQPTVGIDTVPTRATLEVSGVAGSGNTSALFGGDGTGLSFQRNWPAIGFNQFSGPGGSPYRIGYGSAAKQYLDPASGIMALDMSSQLGFANSSISGFNRAFSLFPNGTVSFGTNQVNTTMVVDNAAPAVLFKGTQFDSWINYNNSTGLQPGKSGGVTFINDIPGNVSLGTFTAPYVAVNAEPAYLTALTVNHPADGTGMVLIETGNYNHWTWWVSNDNPSWIGLNYNDVQIADFNPTNGVYSYVSDARLKTNVKPLSPVLKKVMQLMPVTYNMKNDVAKKLNAGFIAQEVKETFPGVVSVIYDTSAYNKGWKDTHMISYNDFYVIAVKAIQEQQQEIKELLNELSELETALSTKNKGR